MSNLCYIMPSCNHVVKVLFVAKNKRLKYLEKKNYIWGKALLKVFKGSIVLWRKAICGAVSSYWQKITVEIRKPWMSPNFDFVIKKIPHSGDTNSLAVSRE